MTRKILLICGVLSSVLYVGADIVAAMRYEGYSYTAQAVSELSAIGAPTRSLLVPVYVAYDLLLIAFGYGLWTSARQNRALRASAGLLAGIGAVGLAAMRFPMNLRGTEMTLTDTMHIIVTGMTVLLILLAIGFGAGAFGRRFRVYSIATLATVLVFGALTALEAPRIAAGLPTPWLGVTERINIGAYLLWMAVLAVMVLRARNAAAPDRLRGKRDAGLTAARPAA